MAKPQKPKLSKEVSYRGINTIRCNLETLSWVPAAWKEKAGLQKGEGRNKSKLASGSLLIFKKKQSFFFFLKGKCST